MPPLPQREVSTWVGLLPFLLSLGCTNALETARPLEARAPRAEVASAHQQLHQQKSEKAGADRAPALTQQTTAPHWRALPSGLQALAEAENEVQSARGEGVDDSDSLPESPLCKRLLRGFQEKLKGVPATVDNGGGGFAPKQWNYCWPTKGGAWAIEPIGLKGDDEDVLTQGHFQILHVDNRGRVHRGPKRPFEAHSFSEHVLFGETFDYDGDGEKELGLFERHGGHTGSGTMSGSLWTLRKGRVSAYPTPFKSLVLWAQLDGDGRPDLVTTGGFDGVTEPCTAGSTDASVDGAYLIARSLPDGSFETDGDLSTKWAKEFCEERPKIFDEGQQEGLRILPAAHRLQAIRCARLWGISSESIQQTLRAVCEARDEKKGEFCYGAEPKACPGLQTMLAWAQVDPPFQFKQPVPTQSFALSDGRKLVVRGKQASVLDHDGTKMAFNAQLIRLQDEDPHCPSDGFMGVDVSKEGFTIHQVSCGGWYTILERSVFEYSFENRSFYLRQFSLEFVDRGDPPKDAELKILSGQQLDSLKFQDVALESLYERLLR